MLPHFLKVGLIGSSDVQLVVWARTQPMPCVAVVRGYLSRALPRSRSEHLDRRGGSRDQFVALGAVERDPDRNALRQPHPVEGRIDVGKQGRAGAAIAVFDTRRDAFHPSAAACGGCPSAAR